MPPLRNIKRKVAHVHRNVKRVKYESKTLAPFQSCSLAQMQTYENELRKTQQHAPIIYESVKRTLYGVLADPPGYGKTFTMANLIKTNKKYTPHTMIVCSDMAIFMWARELEALKLRTHTIGHHLSKTKWQKAMENIENHKNMCDVLIVVPSALAWLENFYVDRLVIDEIFGVYLVHLKNVQAQVRWFISANPITQKLYGNLIDKSCVTIIGGQCERLKFTVNQYTIQFYDHFNLFMSHVKIRIQQWDKSRFSLNGRTNVYSIMYKRDPASVQDIFANVLLKTYCTLCYGDLTNVHVELNCHQLYCARCTTTSIECKFCNQVAKFEPVPCAYYTGALVCKSDSCIAYKSQEHMLINLLDKICAEPSPTYKKIVLKTRSNVHRVLDKYGGYFAIFTLTKLTSASIQFRIDEFNAQNNKNYIFVLNATLGLNFHAATHIIDYDLYNAEFGFDESKYQEYLLGRALCLSRDVTLPLDYYKFAIHIK